MSEAFKKFDLTGKTALVTGGATGLGYHMARALAISGARVVICARREDVLKSAVDTLSKDVAGGDILYRTVDLGDRQSIARLSEYCMGELGGIDIFIGNAGQDMLQPIEAITDDAIDQMVQVNLSANVELVRGFVPHMRQKRWGRILFSSSATTVCASPHEGASMYTAVKGALNSYTRTAATELGHDGITVNSLILGMFLTDIMRGVFDQVEQAQGPGAGAAALKSFSSMIALGRCGEVEEIEGLIQLLASDAGSYITGSNLAIDGGLSIMLRPNQPA
ncbi:gluconate 5-dehydrogenase [Sphingobium faniae]|nr:gluconate 5-dehydrogenase [Sphingobium faniae]